MIRRLKLRNFKSILDADLELRSLNILIGPNGSGKSNLLNFFHLLREAADQRLNARINAMGGFSQMIFYDAYNVDTVNWELELDGQESPHYYTGSLRARGAGGYSVQREEIARDPYPNHDNRYKFLSVENGHVRILKSLPVGVSGNGHNGAEYEDEGAYDEASDQELAIAQIRNRSRYPILSTLRSELADWQIISGFGNDALKNMRGPQLFNVVEPMRLEPLAGNLISILHALANQSRYRAINDRLYEVLRAVFPDFEKLDLPVTAGGTGSLGYRSRTLDETVPALSMSDGQLRFLGLVVLLLLPDPPPLIAIDEPELGLHPDMMAILVELFREVTAQGKTQLLVATHAPGIVDAVAPADVIVVENTDGRSRFQRLDPSRLEQWLDRYTLGKLWTMGRLAIR